MPEIQRADPRVRRKAVLLVACGMVAGLVIIPLTEFYRPALVDWITRDPEQIDSRLRLAVAVLAVAFAGPLLGFAAYLWRLGNHIVRAERFPAAGAVVMRDTVVLQGTPARRRGRLMQLVAVLLVSAVTAFTVVLWQLVSLLGSRSP
ncbi:MAG: hypothetical protein L0387_30565 [Acidobacteria bacterium]|nr:hypothetical protein [Acidobacteriota bacterium]